MAHPTTTHRPANARVRFAWAVVAIFIVGISMSDPAARAAPPPGGERPAAGQARTYSKGLLWKIEGAAAKPSYLFGTIHSDDARLTTLPTPVKQRFDQAASFTMEVLVNGPGMVAMAEAMYFNDDNTLEGVLGQDLYQRTVKALAKHGLAREAVVKMKPWAAIMSLSLPPPSSGLFLDLMLQLEAARQAKPTHGLETMAEQIAVFNELLMQDQVALLRETVSNHDTMAQQIEELMQAYLKRDLAGLAAIEQKYRIEDARLRQLLADRLLVKRNRLMLERMRPRLREGNAFIAVGALHLSSGDGLLALLENAGYRVSAVY